MICLREEDIAWHGRGFLGRTSCRNLTRKATSRVGHKHRQASPSRVPARGSDGTEIQRVRVKARGKGDSDSDSLVAYYDQSINLHFFCVLRVTLAPGNIAISVSKKVRRRRRP
jgi:hypothetical protein